MARKLKEEKESRKSTEEGVGGERGRREVGKRKRERERDLSNGWKARSIAVYLESNFPPHWNSMQ